MLDKYALVGSGLLLALGTVACKPSSDEGEGDTVADDTETGTSEGTESGDTTDEAETSDTEETGPEEGPCFDDLERWTWDGSASAVGYDLPAPDFTVETLRGTKTFSEIWNGCDNHVFVVYSANWWSSPIEPLVDDSAENTHYWFVVAADDAAIDQDMRTALVGQIAQKIEGYLESLGEDVHAENTDEFHYVLDSGLDMPVVAQILASNPGEAHFTVDRHQIVREGHNVAVYNGAWTPLLEQTRWWSKYVNGQYALDAALVAQEDAGEVLVHRVADAVEITGGVPYEWTLPDAETIAQYGKLEVDMLIDCPGAGHPYGATCGEWDTVGSIMLCGDDECTGENQRRVVKWITPYSSPGRWVIDITPEMIELAAGGTLKFVSYHGDNNVGQYTYRYTVDLRFSQREDGLRPIAKTELVPRGNYGWNDNFHMTWSDFAFDAPPETEATELYARISGHGAVDGSNCAEFCTFTHEFTVNGTPFEHQYLMENVDRCAEYVDRGVTPNQGGTWFFDRSSWCPGWTIEEWRADLTDAVIVGDQNAVSYDSWYGSNQPPPGGNMDMRVEVVFYGP